MARARTEAMVLKFSLDLGPEVSTCWMPLLLAIANTVAPPEEAIRLLFDHLDCTDKKQIELHEFCSWLSNLFLAIRNFQASADKTTEAEARRIEAAEQESMMGEVMDLFSQFDRDSSQTLDLAEFTRMCSLIGNPNWCPAPTDYPTTAGEAASVMLFRERVRRSMLKHPWFNVLETNHMDSLELDTLLFSGLSKQLSNQAAEGNPEREGTVRTPPPLQEQVDQNDSSGSQPPVQQELSAGEFHKEFNWLHCIALSLVPTRKLTVDEMICKTGRLLDTAEILGVTKPRWNLGSASSSSPQSIPENPEAMLTPVPTASEVHERVRLQRASQLAKWEAVAVECVGFLFLSYNVSHFFSLVPQLSQCSYLVPTQTFKLILVPRLTKHKAWSVQFCLLSF